MKEKPAHAPIRNEAGNGLENKRGTLAMARTNVPDSATAQFFINIKDNAFLDRATARDNVGYTVFGRVIAGMDVIDKIRKVKTTTRGPHADVPVMPVVIRALRRAAELTLVLSGPVAPGKRFTITAYVAYPVRGQSLTLELPPGVERLEGADIQPVAPSFGISLVVWKARALRPGTFAITVRSSTGASRSQAVKCAAAPGGR